MARPASEPEDATPLDGSRIDVSARIGWLLRTNRLAQGIPLRAMAQRLAEAGTPYSVATLSRVETGALRHGAVTGAYERALGLPHGALRSPIDVVCRTFPYSPADVDPDLPTRSLAGFSAACASVASDRPSGPDWLRFAEHHQTGVGLGLPEQQMRPLVRRLASEVGRSVGVAYTTRYEALARLRCSEYADLVDEVARELVLEPAAQVVNDLMSAVAELPTPELLRWTGELLAHPSPPVALGATLAIQNMRSVDGLDAEEWRHLVTPFVRAYDAAADDRRRREQLTLLFKNLPPATRSTIQGRLAARLEPVRGPEAWSPSARNRHFQYVAGLADRVCSTTGMTGRPILTRLLFECLYDFRATRVVTASFLLNASPFVPVLQPLILEAVRTGPDGTTRHGAAALLSALMVPWRKPDVAGWLTGEDVTLAQAGLVVTAHAGAAVPVEVLRGLLADQRVDPRLVLYSAGMCGHAALPDLAGDPTLPPSVRAGAQWWLRQGRRIER
jgi:hypothetical protein